MSAADLIGHRYGPYSQEVMDYYLRLDAALGDFLAYLDEQVGADRYAVILSSDHGVAPMPEEASRRGIDAHRVSTADFRDELVAGLQQGLLSAEIYDQPSLALMTIGLVAAFTDPEVTEAQRKTLREHTAQSLVKAPVVAEAFTYDQFMSQEKIDSPYEGLFRRSFHPDRAADVIINFREFYVYPASLPATHGAPYRYDMHVPLLVRSGATPRQVDRQVRTVDVAPTLARLLGITAPDDLDGSVLLDALPN